MKTKTKIRRGHKVTPIKATHAEVYLETIHKSQAGVPYTHYKKIIVSV